MYSETESRDVSWRPWRPFPYIYVCSTGALMSNRGCMVMMKFWSSPITWISLKLSVISVMTFFKEITISIQHNGVQIISLTLPPSTAVLPSGSAGRQKGSTPTIPGGHLQLSPMHLSCGSTWFTDWGEKTSKTVPPQSHIYRLIVGFCSSLVSPD